MLKRIYAIEAPIAFIDLQAQRRQIANEIDIAIARVLDHGQFVLGKEVDAAEKKLADFCGATHAITCASGTDALALILMAANIGPGDAVICPAFTFAAPAEVIALRGAVPIFADVLPKTFNIDPSSAKAAIDLAREKNLQPKALIAVDLFGQPANYDELSRLCDAEGLMLIDDAAQSFGATYDSKPTGTLAHATATSFFPAKPLGCYGDGGAVFTDDADHADRLRSLRMHGQGVDRYEHPRVGLNSRLDAIQAAILVEKLRIFPAEIIARGRVAARYNDAFAEFLTIPTIDQRTSSVWAQYTLRLGDRDRESFRAALQADEVPTAVHYPHGLHRQEAYSRYPVANGAAPVSDKLASEVVSLPMHAYLDEPSQDRVIASVLRAID